MKSVKYQFHLKAADKPDFCDCTVFSPFSTSPHASGLFDSPLLKLYIATVLHQCHDAPCGVFVVAVCAGALLTRSQWELCGQTQLGEGWEGPSHTAVTDRDM